MKSVLAAALVAAMATPVMAEDSPFGFSFMLLSRFNDSGTALITDGAPAVSTVISTDNLGASFGGGVAVDFETQAFGFPASIRAILSPVQGGSASDPGYAHTTAGVSVASADAGGSGIFGGSIIGLGAFQESELYSLEVNGDFASREATTFSAGIRTIKFGDDLMLNFDAGPSGFPGSTNDHTQLASNTMFGPQIGFEADIPGPTNDGYSLSVFGNIGWLKNSSNYTFFRTGGGLLAGTTTAPTTVSGSNWTGMAEFGLNAKMETGDRSGVTLGLNFLYLDEVATSTASLATTTFASSTGAISYDSVLYGTVSARWEMKF